MIACTFFVQIVSAQTFGIKGGINFANMTYSGSGVSGSETWMTGFHLGLVADFKLQEQLYFNTGLLYSMKGAGSDALSYLEIPLNVAYKFSTNKTSDFFIQSGPYLAYDVTIFGGSMKRFDFGLGFGAGVQFSSIVTSLNYELGLANLNDNSYPEPVKRKNKVLQISVAYMFGSKK